MKRYYVTAPSFGGFVEYIYNASGLLVYFNTQEAILNAEQLFWFVNNIPTTLDEFNKVVISTPNLNRQQITQEITFDMIWNRYDDKLTSSRKRAQIKWQKMSDADKVKAYYFIPSFFNSLGAGIR